MKPHIQRPSSGLRSENAEQARASVLAFATAEPGAPLGQEAEPRDASQPGLGPPAGEDTTPEAQSMGDNEDTRHTTPTRVRGSPPRPSSMDSPFRRPAALLGLFVSGLQSPEVRDMDNLLCIDPLIDCCCRPLLGS